MPPTAGFIAQSTLCDLASCPVFRALRILRISPRKHPHHAAGQAALHAPQERFMPFCGASSAIGGLHFSRAALHPPSAGFIQRRFTAIDLASCHVFRDCPTCPTRPTCPTKVRENHPHHAAGQAALHAPQERFMPFCGASSAIGGLHFSRAALHPPSAGFIFQGRCFIRDRRASFSAGALP